MAGCRRPNGSQGRYFISSAWPLAKGERVRSAEIGGPSSDPATRQEQGGRRQEAEARSHEQGGTSYCRDHRLALSSPYESRCPSFECGWRRPRHHFHFYFLSLFPFRFSRHAMPCHAGGGRVERVCVMTELIQGRGRGGATWGGPSSDKQDRGLLA